MKRLVLQAMVAAVMLAILGLGTREARAQRASQILVSQKPVPSKPAALKKWKRHDTTKTLKSNKAGNKWEFYYLARLRKTPPVNVVNLVFYEYRPGRRPKYINAEDVKLAGAVTHVIGKGKMHKILGFKKGRRYQIRITIKDNRGNEIPYARSGLILLK